MYLFSRVLTLAGPPAESVAYAVDMRQYVADTTGRDIALWSAAFGAPVGTVAYAMRVADLPDLQSLTTSLLADAEYHKRLAAGQAFVGAPAVDNLARPMLGELGDGSPPVGSVATLTTATMAAGKYADAVGWSLDIAQHVSKVSGIPTMFLTSEFGTFGNVSWIAVAPDMAAAQAGFDAVNGDADYLAKLGNAGDLFLPGSGNRGLMTRIA